MATVTTAAKAPARKTVDAQGFIVSKAKNFVARDTAFHDIQVHAYSEGLSRAQLVAAIKVALGKAPTVQELEIAQREFVIGRVAGRLAPSDFPKADMSAVDKLAFARDLVTCYAMPHKDGMKKPTLRNGQKGRRTPAQHKVIRAAAEAWSQVKAEIAPEQSKAQTQATRNALKVAAVKNGAAPASGRGKKGNATAAAPTALSHPELVKAPTEMQPVEARAHILTQAASLLSFANKYAGQLPTDFGAAVRAFKAAVDKAEALAKSVEA